MTRNALIAGGGLGGLSAGIALRRAGREVRLFEQARAFSEVGAGIQLGPNATRILQGWGLGQALARAGSLPQRLVVRDAADGAVLGTLELGQRIAARYGAPYVTLHRADLQALLLDAAQAAGVQPELGSRAAEVLADHELATVRLEDGTEVHGDVLVGADGLWSNVRRQVWRDGEPASTGHLAYRGVVSQAELPVAQRSLDVNVWLGPRMHLVAYPVRGGDELNVVAIVEGTPRGPVRDWDQDAITTELHGAMGELCMPLRDLVGAMPGWRLWALHDRAPVRRASDMARGRVALLGDAAHPMRPYFAQGAGMAIEDAAELGRVLGPDGDAAAALNAYAAARWQRCARVQAMSRRNGWIFHASGPVAWGRNLGMRLLGERLLDQPWLYGT